MEKKVLPIKTTFKFPSRLPTIPPGQSSFAGGVIDLDYGLKICRISSFNKVWATHDGGPGNLGATFFEPSKLPRGFSVFGYYCQPNSKSFFGWVLVGRDDNPNGTVLKKPLDYDLVWSSKGSNIKRDKDGYIWLPTPPVGYRAVGHVVTTSSGKPSFDKIRCVREDLTEPCEKESWIWGPARSRDDNAFNVFSLRPTNRGIEAPGVSVGTFVALSSATSSSSSGSANSLDLFCLRNSSSISAAMPEAPQVDALFKAYSPLIYFHSKEKYLPSSMAWFFSNGALLYNKSDETKHVKVDPNGSNLPQGGGNDGLFWLDLPIDNCAKERVKHGDLQTCQAYLHIKPMLGGTFTDIATWLFFPFKGPATVKVGSINFPFRTIGKHIGDWEHITLRINNFNGELSRVYFAQHSGGIWVDAPELEFEKDNKVAAYSSFYGHALYPKAGLVMQGDGEIGLKNETEKSRIVLDTGAKFSVLAAEYLEPAVTQLPWLNYFRQWGPKIDYRIAEDMEMVEKLLPEKLKEAFKRFIIDRLANEILGREGPTGPKLKDCWNGDERS